MKTGETTTEVTWHSLKTNPLPFEALWDRRKRFEMRLDDRGFDVGHYLNLFEHDPNTGERSGRAVNARVLYLLRGPAYGIPERYAIMSIEEVSRAGGSVPPALLDPGREAVEAMERLKADAAGSMMLDVQADCIAARKEVAAFSAKLEEVTRAVEAVRAYLAEPRVWSSASDDKLHRLEDAVTAALSLTPSAALDAVRTAAVEAYRLHLQSLGLPAPAVGR